MTDRTALPSGPSFAAEHQARHGEGPLWVFAYGSLMWRPGFPFREERSARVHGWRRTLCIKSIQYRGTPEQPGLVMGLDRGGSCLGRAYLVDPADRVAAVQYLDDRELTTRSYHARFLSLTLDDGRRVRAYGYVADPAHPQYAGPLSLAEKVALIVAGRGREGPCRDYLANTVRHLDALGIADPALHDVLNRVEAALALHRARQTGHTDRVEG